MLCQTNAWLGEQCWKIYIRDPGDKQNGIIYADYDYWIMLRKINPETEETVWLEGL